MRIQRQTILLVFLFFIAVNSLAQSTEELLRARRVNDFIYLEPDITGKSVEYQLDKMKNTKLYGKPFSDNLSVTVSPRDKAINILIKYFNPFQNKVVLSDTLLTDDNYEALNKFFESVSSLVSTLSEKNPGINPEKLAGGAAPATLVSVSGFRSPMLQQWKYLFKHGDIIKCTPPPASFLKALEVTDKYFYTDEDISFENRVSSVLKLVNTASSLTALKTAFENPASNDDDFKEILTITDQINKDAKASVAILENEVKNLALADPAGSTLHCEDFASYTKDVLKTFLNDVKDKQKKREEVQAQLVELRINLEEFLKKSTTFEENGNKIEAVRIGTYLVNEEKTREVTMVIKERSVSFDNSKITVAEKGDILSRKIRIRSHRPLIPEFATGLFYTSLTYKNYIANNKGSSIVVEEGKEEKTTVVAAAHLNLVFDVWTDACPMLQIGVGTAKERPSLLLGGGLRFSKPKKLSLSVGAIWTWKKELTNLSVGEVITESAALDKDLKLNLDTKPGLYIGLQYNF